MDTDARSRRAPRKVSARYLENAALAYLQRFATSAENLRRVLMRKVARSARHHGTDPDESARLVDELIARYRRAGLLDDAAYAEGRARSLRRQGRGARAILGRLREKGIDADTARAALAAAGEEAGGDLAAAARLARRKRLGPHRPPGGDGDDSRRTRREYAALARAGFDLDTARRVIEAPDPGTLEAWERGDED